MIKKTDIETYIFIHDQNIIIDYEESGKFNQFTDYKYVFLGFGDVDKITNLKNLIIARDFETNYENYPKMCAYSGWFLLYKNRIPQKKYINLFEYDVSFSENFSTFLLSEINSNKCDFYGYIPIDINHNFLNDTQWVSEIYDFYNKKNQNLYAEITSIIKGNNIKNWMATSNMTISTEYFNKYMFDSENIFGYLKDKHSVGHSLERFFSFYWLLNFKETKIGVIPNILKHFQLDSHKTQGIKVSNINDTMVLLKKNKY